MNSRRRWLRVLEEDSEGAGRVLESVAGYGEEGSELYVGQRA